MENWRLNNAKSTKGNGELNGKWFMLHSLHPSRKYVISHERWKDKSNISAVICDTFIRNS
jgi:hypothetical protein